MTASAPFTRQSGPNRLAHALGARAGHGRVLSGPGILALRQDFESPKPIAFLAALISEDAGQRRRSVAAAKLQASVTQLLSIAEKEEWSLRTLARKAGLTWSSWRRVRAGKVDSLCWLPKLETALARLKPC